MQKGGIKYVQIKEKSDWEDSEVCWVIDHPGNNHILCAELYEVGV